MASYPPDITSHVHWPPVQDNRMARANQSEPTTPNSPDPGMARFRTSGPPSSRSWAGFERSSSFDMASGYERLQPAPERTMSYGKMTLPPSGGNHARGPSLPPLRELVPDFDRLRTSTSQEPRPFVPSATSSPGGEFARSTHPAPDYTHSPTQSKRRRLSHGDGPATRDSRVPRSYSHYSMPRREPPLEESREDERATWSPTLFPGLSASRRPQEPRPSPYGPQRSPNSPWGDAPSSVMLPRLPDMGEPQGRSPLDPPRGGMAFVGHNAYHPGPQSHHLSHGPPQMYGAARSLANYGSYADERMDRKPRKRRGNLPKETTDFLFAWLQSHTSHAYPSEEEKQWMMRETGLQLNQVSNWFINARRRKLPTMMANAKVEADVMGWTESPRSAHGRALSLDADDHDVHEPGTRRKSLKRGYETMNRESV